MLAEISLPKLALAWLLMLILPSIVLGLVPLAATVWLSTVKWKLDRAIREIWPVVLLAALIALGWYGGPRFLRLAKSSFWTLNSLAVEPIYLIVREIFRYLAESSLPTGASDNQYRTRRAAASVVAGFVICALAVLVMSIAWKYSRWLGTTEDLTSLLRLPPIAIANSAVLVAGYLAVAALAWGIADATISQPHTLDQFAEPAGQGRTWRIAHLSDVHVVGHQYGFRLESGRSGPRGNTRFRQVLDRLEAIHAENPLDAVLITGDMTDAGTSAEWAEFLDALADHPVLSKLLLLLPGNHDLNVADRSNPARLELPTSSNRRLRQLRTLSAMNAIQGDRVHVVDFANQKVGPCLADTLRPHLDEIATYADTGKPLFSRLLADLWRDIFPMIVPPKSDDGLGIILLNSNIDTQFSFTSALGMISIDQVRGIEIVARQFPKACWMLALHHHLVEYPRAGQALAERIGTALINGNWFVRRMKILTQRAVVMHGHRHVDWIGQCAGLTIVSAPSPVMEATDDQPTCFYIISLAIRPDSQLDLLKPQRIQIA